MKEAIGSYWLTTIVLTFIVLFTGYLCLSINMNKAYKVKNEIINIIQKNNGLNDEALDQIQEYMIKVGYRTKGTCDSDDGDGFTTTGHGFASKGNAVFCAKMMEVNYSTDDGTKEQFPKAAYYQVKVFFAVDMPIVRNIFTFQIAGSTKKMYYVKNFS